MGSRGKQSGRGISSNQVEKKISKATTDVAQAAAPRKFGSHHNKLIMQDKLIFSSLFPVCSHDPIVYFVNLSYYQSIFSTYAFSLF